MRLVLFGAPGAGKGTQAERLVAEFHLLHLSTGEVLRNAILGKTQLGTKAKVYMDRGDLVPDELVIGIVTHALNAKRSNRGFILDGFPRTIFQAQELEMFLREQGLDLNSVISLEVKEEELVSRINSRRSSSEVKRMDDNEDTVRSRFRAFVNQSLPLKQFYADRDLLKEIDGSGSVANVYESVRAAAMGQ